MNNRANLAFNLLPVVALVLCGAALFAFLNLDDSFSDKSTEFALLTSDLSVTRQYLEASAQVILLEAANEEFTKEAIQMSSAKHNLRLTGQGNFFTKIEDGDFTIIENGDNFVLEVPEVFIQSRQGSNFGQSTFNFGIEVDSRGEFIRFINK